MSLNFTSIYGRWLGVTYGSSAGTGGGQNKYLSGDVQGVKMKNLWFGAQGSEVPEYGPDATQTLTSGTTATVLVNAGVTVFNSSSALTWNMGPPTNASARKYLWSLSTANGVITVALSAGNFQSTAGSSFTKVSLNSPGDGIALVAVSTAVWGILSNTSSAAPTT